MNTILKDIPSDIYLVRHGDSVGFRLERQDRAACETNVATSQYLRQEIYLPKTTLKYVATPHLQYFLFLLYVEHISVFNPFKFVVQNNCWHQSFYVRNFKKKNELR